MSAGLVSYPKYILHWDFRYHKLSRHMRIDNRRILSGGKFSYTWLFSRCCLFNSYQTVLTLISVCFVISDKIVLLLFSLSTFLSFYHCFISRVVLLSFVSFLQSKWHLQYTYSIIFKTVSSTPASRGSLFFASYFSLSVTSHLLSLLFPPNAVE